jgi:hypothetical protein
MSARTSLHPHEGSPSTLHGEAAIYAQGRTPVRVGGQLAAWDAKPLGAPQTAVHLREIQRRWGAQGLERSVRGLAETRGTEFAHRAAEQAGLPAAGGSSQGGAIGPQATHAIRSSRASGSLPHRVRRELTDSSGHDFQDIAVHNDAAAHRAADQLQARAFTVGRGIYFARNQYQPSTAAGRHLLAHEAAHAVQQRGNGAPPDEHFRTTASAGREEDEANRFADFVAGARLNPPPPLTPSTQAGLVCRAISFTHANDAVDTAPITSEFSQSETGFRLESIPGPAFKWNTEVTIHGAAGDPFGNFQVGYLQVERQFECNVFWGSGANQSHRNIRADHLPRRDAQTESSIFVGDAAPEVVEGYTGDGDVRSLSTTDTPNQPEGGEFPYDNPIAGRTGSSGYFNFTDAFVTYVSSRDKTSGAFHDIANIYWNISATGQFDKTQPAGSRLKLTGGSGPVNKGPVQNGGSAEFPAIHGGPIANGHDITTDT